MGDRALPFELERLGASPEVSVLLKRRPDDIRSLTELGIPKAFITAQYRALPSLTITKDLTGQLMVQFGTTVLGGSMVLDPGTGNVIELVGEVRNRLFVNSTLLAFATTVRQISDAFPFYPDDANEDQIKTATASTAEIIRSVDSQAMAPDQYWSTFVDDMLMGDWATGAVLDLVAAGY